MTFSNTLSAAGRRSFLRRMSFGVTGAALGTLWAEDEKFLRAGAGPHFAPKVKSVIFLFMCGGVSAMDTFDPKDNKWAGKMLDTINGRLTALDRPEAGSQSYLRLALRRACKSLTRCFPALLFRQQSTRILLGRFRHLIPQPPEFCV